MNIFLKVAKISKILREGLLRFVKFLYKIYIKRYNAFI